MVVTLALALRDLDCRSILGVFRASKSANVEVAKEAEKHGLAVEYIPCTGRLDWIAVRRIRELVHKQEVDVLHPQGYKSDVYAYMSTRRESCHLVATSHNWLGNDALMRAYALLDRKVLRRFDRVVVMSEEVRQRLLRAGVRSEAICAISNGVDVERFQGGLPNLRHELGRPGPLIGFVGRLVPDKGGQILLRAAEQVLREAPGVTFVFIGEGPSRNAWQELAVELGIGQRVAFVGERRDMPEVYSSLDLFVLPSLVEAMPMCLLEAMAAGKPVIATSVGSIPRVIAPERTGLLVAPGDAGGLALSMLRVLSNCELASHLGSCARKEVHKRYSARVMAEKYLQVYEQVVGQRLEAAVA